MKLSEQFAMEEERIKTRRVEREKTKLTGYHEMIMRAINIKPRGKLELQQILGIKRSRTNDLLVELNLSGKLHGKKIPGSVTLYYPGPGAPLKKTTETPRSDPRNFAIRQEQKQRADGSLDETHRVIKFGDQAPPSHGLRNRLNISKCGSSIAW